MTKQLPFDIDAEEAVLGSILIDPDALLDVSLILKPTDFYKGDHAAIYRAMLALYQNQRGIDAKTVAAAMGESADISQIVGLVSIVPTSLHAVEYARIVKAHSTRRQLIRAAGKIATSAFDISKPIDTTIQETEQHLIELVQDRHKTGPEHIGDVAVRALSLSERAANGEILTIPTGLADLDEITGGLQSPDFTILAARPGMGKTALLLQVALHAALAGRRVAMFPLEMSAEQLSHRFISHLTGRPYKDVLYGRFDDWRPYYGAVEQMEQLKIYIDDAANLTPLALRSKCRQVAAWRGLDLVMVDYAGLMAPDGKHVNRVSESAEISRALKLLALELGVPVLVAHQLNRAVESRGAKKPALSDLRDSGSWEQDADQVWMLWRDDYDAGTTANIHIAKNRRGQTGERQFYWNGPSMSFANLARGIPS